MIFASRSKSRSNPPGPGSVDDRRVLQARLQIVVDSLTATIIFNPLFALSSAVALSLPHSPFGPVPYERLAIALAGQLSGAAVALYVYRRFRQVTLESVQKVGLLLLLSQIMFSAVWGAVSFLYWVPGNEVNHVYVTMVMALVAFSAVFARSMHIPIMTAALVVQCGLFLLRLAVGEGVVAQMLMPMVPLFVFYLFTMGRMSHRRVGAMIAARFANEDLTAALIHARDEAMRKRYEAETANASKTAFLANMSHELRTPLNAILGFSDIIAHQSMGADQWDRYSEYAGDIHGSGVHLLSLINDLLDIAKIEAGKMDIERREMDPRPVVESVIRLMAPRAASRDQTLSVDIAPDLPPILADERAVKQMLLNLVSNAVKFTPEGGRVSLACRGADDGGLEFCVSDSGPGIAPEKLAQVFEPFSQIDNRFDREAGGTGLGLALVRGLARLHGGRAWLVSKLGAGVQAHIYLPATFAGASAGQAAQKAG